MSKSTGKRDMQRMRFHLAFRDAFPVEGRTLLPAWDTIAFLKRAWDSRWTHRTFPGAVPRSGTDLYARASSSYRGHVRLCPADHHKAAILHYLAHAIAPVAESESHHGPSLCRRFLLLVQHFLGLEAAKRLRVAYKAHGVKYSKPREMTEEHLAALRARAGMMRARNPKVIVRRRITVLGLSAAAPVKPGTARKVRLSN